MITKALGLMTLAVNCARSGAFHVPQDPPKFVRTATLRAVQKHHFYELAVIWTLYSPVPTLALAPCWRENRVTLHRLLNTSRRFTNHHDNVIVLGARDRCVYNSRTGSLLVTSPIDSQVGLRPTISALSVSK